MPLEEIEIDDQNKDEFDQGSQLPSYAAQDPDLTRWQLSSEDILVWIEHDLRGEVFDEELKKWHTPDGARPLANEMGIREIISMARINVSKITFLSDLDEEHVLMLTRETHKDLAQLIATNYRIYNVDKSHFNVIIKIVIFRLFAALRRAWQEGERKHLRSIERRSYVSQESSNASSKGGSWWNPFSGKK